MVVALVVVLALRTPFDLDVLRPRGTLFAQTHDGMLRNEYELRILNQGQSPARFTIGVRGLPGAVLQLGRPIRQQPLQVMPGEVLSVPASVLAPVAAVAPRPAVDLVIELCRADDSGACTQETTRFLGPA